MTDTTDKPRLPPGQGLIRNPDNWPVLGETAPRDDDSPWMIRVTGEVERPLEIALTDLMARPRTELISDIHCVTRWSRPATTLGAWRITSGAVAGRP